MLQILTAVLYRIFRATAGVAFFPQQLLSKQLLITIVTKVG
jgi:hypothetical protein